MTDLTLDGYFAVHRFNLVFRNVKSDATGIFAVVKSFIHAKEFIPILF